MEESFMVISIDHGNFAIKTLHHSFVAGLAEHTVKPPISDEIIEYKGKYWTLSGQRLSYMRDKTKDDRYFILTLFAIAKELQTSGSMSSFEQIDLAVGLPPEHFGILKEKFAEYFRKEGLVKFFYQDHPISIMIKNVCVYPQAYAAVIPQSGKLIHTLRTFIIDVGGYTTDVLLLRNGKPDLQFCRSLELGTITMNNEIIRKVGALHDMIIDDEHISAVLSSKETILPLEVQKTILKEAEIHTKNILDKLRELQVDLRSNPAIFIGGGSVLFRKYIESSPLVAKADFIEDTKANAIGYNMLACRQLGQQSVL